MHPWCPFHSISFLLLQSPPQLPQLWDFSTLLWLCTCGFLRLKWFCLMHCIRKNHTHLWNPTQITSSVRIPPASFLSLHCAGRLYLSLHIFSECMSEYTKEKLSYWCCLPNTRDLLKFSIKSASFFFRLDVKLLGKRNSISYSPYVSWYQLHVIRTLWTFADCWNTSLIYFAAHRSRIFSFGC